MKHSLITLIFASAALFLIVSCNDDDETTAPPAPTFIISGESVDPVTGAVSQWGTNSVTAELDTEGFRIKAVRGVDTLFIAIAGVDSGTYFIDQEPPLGPLNRLESVGENGLALYTFQANGNGGGTFNITESDSLNRTVTGDFSVRYFNPINNSDFFELNNAQFRNLNYTLPSGVLPTPGVGSISFLSDGVVYNYDDATGALIDSVIVLEGLTPITTAPSINISINPTIEPGIYLLPSDTVGEILFVRSGIEFFNSDTGRVEILVHDTIEKNISGSFNFLGIAASGNGDSVQVVNGLFEMNYDE